MIILPRCVQTDSRTIIDKTVCQTAINEMVKKEILSALSGIDWSRENPVWDGNLIQDKKMVRTTVGIELGAAAILEHCKISVLKKPKGSKK